jgi:hypothetical protein
MMKHSCLSAIMWHLEQLPLLLEKGKAKQRAVSANNGFHPEKKSVGIGV